MDHVWILSANSHRARLMSAQRANGPLCEIESFDHPAGRAKPSDLESDRPGRLFDSVGMGRHATSPVVDMHTQEQIRFARMLADRLEQGRLDHAFAGLVLVAAPEFLGHLRDAMAAPLAAKVTLALAKNYADLDPVTLRSRLPERL